jgi:predicted nucleotidyltransferase
MGIDSAMIREIINRILSVTKPVKVLLFGSAASEEMTFDSDIDLLVIEELPDFSGKEQFNIRKVLRGLGRPFDIVVMSNEYFEQKKNCVGEIAYPASREGRIIYVRS